MTTPNPQAEREPIEFEINALRHKIFSTGGDEEAFTKELVKLFARETDRARVEEVEWFLAQPSYVRKLAIQGRLMELKANLNQICGRCRTKLEVKDNHET